jgi:hypothetical protein
MANEEDPVLDLLQRTVECYEGILALLCKQPAHVASSHGDIGGGFWISLIGQVTQDDRSRLEKRGDTVVLKNLAASIGDESGIASVSFQLDS